MPIELIHNMNKREKRLENPLVRRTYYLEDIYELYKAYPDKKYHIPMVMYVKIITALLKAHLVEVMSERGLWLMPSMLGVFGVVKKRIIELINSETGKAPSQYIDHAASKLAGKTVYYLNAHSGGYSFGVRWNKTRNFKHFNNYKIYRTKLAKSIKSYFNNLIVETSKDPSKFNIDAPISLFPKSTRR